MDQKSVGVGIIGTGWGVNVQLPAIKAISGIETIALYSRSLDKAKSICKIRCHEVCTGRYDNEWFCSNDIHWELEFKTFSHG